MEKNQKGKSPPNARLTKNVSPFMANLAVLKQKQKGKKILIYIYIFIPKRVWWTNILVSQCPIVVFFLFCFCLDKSITLSLAQWMIFQIFKETIAKTTVYRDFYLVHSLCNVCDNKTWLLIVSAMPNATARPFPSPCWYNSVSLINWMSQLPQNGNVFWTIHTIVYLLWFNLVKAGQEGEY